MTKCTGTDHRIYGLWRTAAALCGDKWDAVPIVADWEHIDDEDVMDTVDAVREERGLTPIDW